MSQSATEQLRLLAANTDRLISETELQSKLVKGASLRVKLGIDPTASDIHLGFAVVLRKLRQFQDLGHTAVVILGDFTAQVGDPTGRSATRPRLTPEEVEANAVGYMEQVARILSSDRLEVRRNSEWLASMNMQDVLALTSRSTVAQMLERDDFARRYEAGAPISVMELLYPLLQGWDSVIVKADVELGGSDQLFNNLMGRHLQQQEGLEPQVVITMPLLVGLDGEKKMSKSLGNAIGITEPPAEQFGKLMRIPDELLESYLALATGWQLEEIESARAQLRSGDLGPNQTKRLMARRVVDLYHGEGAGQGAEAEFDRVFRSHEAPSDIPEFLLPPDALVDGRIRLARLLALAGLVPSNAEGRRKIEQGGVRLQGERVEDSELELTAEALDGATIQVGRRAWARVRRLPT